jgi:hypothetical protein
VQEGLIFVWQTLERGHRVSADMVQNRMLDWMRLLSRQTGSDIPSCEKDPDTGEPRTHDEYGELLLDPCPQHIPYEQLLPLDDFRLVRDVDGAG